MENEVITVIPKMLYKKRISNGYIKAFKDNGEFDFFAHTDDGWGVDEVDADELVDAMYDILETIDKDNGR